MGAATRQENYVEVTDDYSDFMKRIGLLFGPRQMSVIGIPPDEIWGTFWESSSSMLLAFCKENPTYHILTSTGPGRFENRYIPGQKFYLLGEGDKNPNLVLDICLIKNPNLLLEEMLEEALAKSYSVDRGDKAE